MNDKERELLAELHGPDAELLADARRYVTDAPYRARVDALDKGAGTNIGPHLRALGLGLPEPVPCKPAVAPPNEVELAEAIKRFPKERCIQLFRKAADAPGESSSKLSSDDYRIAQMAARFFDVLLPKSGASVRFNYKTPAQYRADAEAEAAQAKATEQQRQNGGVGPTDLPPGITKNDRGELYLSDPVAFEAWKARKAAIQELTDAKTK